MVSNKRYRRVCVGYSEMIALSEGQYAVYKFSFPNGKEYVGVTMDLKRRFRKHRRRDSFVGRAIRKHGFPSIQILAVCEEDYAYDLERKAIFQFNTLVPRGYNLTKGGMGGQKSRGPLSKEHKRRISEANKGHRVLLETRVKISKAHRGKRRGPHSKETRRKISEGNKGKQCSLETRLKISKANTGHGVSEETRRKMSKASSARKGWRHSPEAREKMSKSHMGKTLSEEHRVNISKAGIGRVFSKEHRVNMSKAQKRRWAKVV